MIDLAPQIYALRGDIALINAKLDRALHQLDTDRAELDRLRKIEAAARLVASGPYLPLTASMVALCLALEEQ